MDMQAAFVIATDMPEKTYDCKYLLLLQFVMEMGELDLIHSRLFRRIPD